MISRTKKSNSSGFQIRYAAERKLCKKKPNKALELNLNLNVAASLYSNRVNQLLATEIYENRLKNSQRTRGQKLIEMVMPGRIKVLVGT